MHYNLTGKDPLPAFHSKLNGVPSKDVCLGCLSSGAYLALVSIASWVSCGKPGVSSWCVSKRFTMMFCTLVEV